ncbi:MAG: hypothetical protein E6Q97_20535 [Desulfurellales bacterium]|nr:MAG: hypothetical protein E6Q97_20535 [Desulfurellales bacterium]
MAQGELPFKSMSEKDLVQELARAEASERTRKRKSTKKKSSSRKKSSSKKSTPQMVARRAPKRTRKKAAKRSSTKRKQFYNLEVPVGAAVTITPPCKTPKVAKGTPNPKK